MPEWGLTKEMRESEPWDLPKWWLEPGKVITDAVHGDIHTTRLEQAIVDTPSFQRLRRVRQLGTTHYVYPSATHTRFSHSLGALHVVQVLLDVVIGQRNRNHAVPDLFDQWERQEREERNALATRERDRVGRLVAASAAAPSAALEPATEEADLEAPRRAHLRRLAEATVLARLGALLHDLGHVPYGHSVEDDLKLLVPHDANPGRFERLWDDMFAAIDSRTRERLSRGGVQAATIDGYLRGLAPLRNVDGVLHLSLRPLVLSKRDRDPKDSSKLRDVPADAISEYPFVADMVGNTICADLIDYLQRDHMFTGLPMALGARFMSGFYVTPKRDGGIYGQRMAVLIHREGRPRRDVVTEVLKHLRYRYELQERVLVHHAKLAADAMIGKLIELYDEDLRLDYGRALPEEQARRRRAIPGDFTVDTATFQRAAPVQADLVDGDSQPGREGSLEPSDQTRDACGFASWSIEQLFLARGDDGLLEHLSADGGVASPPVRELAVRLLNRALYRHAANASGAHAAADLYESFGPAPVRRGLERAAAHHAGLPAEDAWKVILWIPGPKMRLKLAEVLVDHGKGIAKFHEYSALGSDIYELHRALWTASVFVHPTISKEQTSAVLARLAADIGICWDTEENRLGAEPHRWPQRLAALQVFRATEMDEKVRRLLNDVENSHEPALLGRGPGPTTQEELVSEFTSIAESLGLKHRRRKRSGPV